MSKEKYFAFAGEPAGKGGVFSKGGLPETVTTVSGDLFKGCIFAQASCITETCRNKGLVKHDSDELLMFIGSDPVEPENLGAELEIRLENDVLKLNETCFVFVPKGAAHGDFEVKSLKKPVYCFTFLMSSDQKDDIPAEAQAAAGTYAGNVVKKYAPVSGKMPKAPEGFLTLLLWIDGKKLAGAPYTEAVWFNRINDEGPPEHEHEFDEFIGFFGSDMSRPGELCGEIEFFIDGKFVSFTKSCLIYIPRGVRHSPIIVPKLERPILHFSGGNGGDYIRSGDKT
ncbi:MAG: hypothetical protein FWG32_08260 [Oscillospiraceae bacterium]|nr:hypothetical protein [Oscillospiraceae bacterium]